MDKQIEFNYLKDMATHHMGCIEANWHKRRPEDIIAMAEITKKQKGVTNKLAKLSMTLQSVDNGPAS